MFLASPLLLLTLPFLVVFYLSVQPYFNSYLLVVRGLSVQSSAYILNTFSLTSAVSSFIVSILIKLTNRYKWYVFAGSCLYMLGTGLMMHFRTETSSIASIVGSQFLIGFGGGMLNVPAQLGVQASASHQELAQATAMFLTMISIGGAIGSAISGAVWSKQIPAKLEKYLPEDLRDEAMPIFQSITTAMEYEPGSPARVAINRSYQETMTTLLTIALCMCAPVILCSLLMSDYKLDEIGQGVKGRVIGGQVDENEKKKDTPSVVDRIVAWIRTRKA